MIGKHYSPVLNGIEVVKVGEKSKVNGVARVASSRGSTECA